MMAKGFTFFYTNAPVSYDYFYVLRITENSATDSNNKSIRLVGIPNDKVEYQTSRYLSGPNYVLSQSEYYKRTKSNLVTLTPKKEIRYYRAQFDFIDLLKRPRTETNEVVAMIHDKKLIKLQGTIYQLTSTDQDQFTKDYNLITSLDGKNIPWT